MSQKSEVKSGTAGRIIVSTSDGKYVKTLVDHDLQLPTDMAVDPELGVMYFTNVGISSPTIEKLTMGGSERSVRI